MMSDVEGVFVSEAMSVGRDLEGGWTIKCWTVELPKILYKVLCICLSTVVWQVEVVLILNPHCMTDHLLLHFFSALIPSV